MTFYYAWILDDAYIYFRYVDNLVFLHNGLVYNRGEYVEGFSSPTWALFLAALRTIRLNYWMIVRLAAVGSFVAFWTLLVVANRRLAGDVPRWRVINFPLIYLTFTYGVLSSFSSGLETPLVQVSAAAFGCLVLIPRSRLLQVLVGAAPLIRHELIIPYAVVFAWLLISTKRVPWVLLLSCLVSLGGWLAFRVVYYAAILPNTFYLKDGMLLKQGIYYLYDVVLPYYTVGVILSFIVAFGFLLQRQGRNGLGVKQRGVMLMLALSATLYEIRIGGDFVHFRYLAFAYCLIIIPTGGIVERLLAGTNQRYHVRFVVPLALIAAAATFMCYPRQVLQHPVFRQVGFKHRPFLNIGDPAAERMNPRSTPPLLSSGEEVELRHAMQRSVRSGSAMSPDSVICTARCETAYRKFRHYVVHSLGLTDPFLARATVPLHRPGHKDSLVTLARDIAVLRRHNGFGIGALGREPPGSSLPRWIEANHETIRAIERRAYNGHRLMENLGLAFRSAGRIRP